MTKRRYPLKAAEHIANDLAEALAPFCERICVAGSIRRRRSHVGDIEIVYVPKWTRDLLGAPMQSLADVAIEGIVAGGVLEPRPNKNGVPVWGSQNKLARHVESGIPVDLFSATQENWWNYLVCRTGPAESNVRIATAARQQGWQWNPYSEGFSHMTSSRTHAVTSEQEVFEFLKLPYQQPEDRE